MNKDKEEIFPQDLERHRIAKLAEKPSRLINFRALLKRIMERGIAVTRGQSQAPSMPPRQQIESGSGKLHPDGVLVFPVATAKRHHPKSIRLCGFDGLSSPFWVNLVIASGTAQAENGGNIALKGTPLSKACGALPNSLRDLFAMRDFLQPTRVGETSIIYPSSFMRSHGYFSHTVWLGSPDRAALDEGLASIGHWLSVNAGDPEFQDFRLNIYYSGHGSPGDSAGDSRFVFDKIELRTVELVAALIKAFVDHRIFADQGTISLSFDCCYSAALIRDFVIALRDIQSQAVGLGIRNLACRTLFASSMGDEESFDEAGLENSYFTSAYLAENSAVRALPLWPTLQEVPLRSRMRQHPMLLRIEPKDKGGSTMRFPVLNLINDDAKKELLDASSEGAILRARAEGLVREDGFIEQIDFLMCKAGFLRDNWGDALYRQIASEKPQIGYDARRTKWD